jgi:hypothetical protein
LRIFSNNDEFGIKFREYHSLIKTTNANGHEPSLWLAEVLSELPYAQTADDYDRLLP